MSFLNIQLFIQLVEWRWLLHVGSKQLCLHASEHCHSNTDACIFEQTKTMSKPIHSFPFAWIDDHLHRLDWIIINGNILLHAIKIHFIAVDIAAVRRCPLVRIEITPCRNSIPCNKYNLARISRIQRIRAVKFTKMFTTMQLARMADE